MALKNKGKEPAARRIGYARIAVWAIVAAVIVVSAAVALRLLQTDGESRSEEEQRKAKFIADKASKKVETNKGQTASSGVTAHKQNHRKRQSVETAAAAADRRKTISELYGTGQPYTNQTEIAKSKYDCFEHPSEVQLAFLVNQPVGAMVIGSWDFDEEFIDDLKKAMVDKIVINEDDSDETIAIKKSVMEVKEELAQRLKEGEDITEVLSTTRDELQKLGIYKEELAEAIEEVQDKDELTDQEVEDFVKAANIMLEEKGIEPLHFSHTTKMILRTKPLSEYGEEEDQEEGEETEQ